MTTTQFILLLVICTLPLLFFFSLQAPQWWYTRTLPKPAVGQIWRSLNSGGRIRIAAIRITDGGMLVWNYQIESKSEWAENGFSPLWMSGYDLRNWWMMLHQERRVLETS